MPHLNINTTKHYTKLIDVKTEAICSDTTRSNAGSELNNLYNAVMLKETGFKIFSDSCTSASVLLFIFVVLGHSVPFAFDLSSTLNSINMSKESYNEAMRMLTVMKADMFSQKHLRECLAICSLAKA